MKEVQKGAVIMRYILQRTFAVAIIGLVTAAPAIAAPDPTGEGPPDSKSCRRSEAATGSIIPGPSVCLTNAQWLALHATKQTISADGKHVVSANGPGYSHIRDQFMGEDRDVVPRGAVISGTP